MRKKCRFSESIMYCHVNSKTSYLPLGSYLLSDPLPTDTFVVSPTPQISNQQHYEL